MPHIIMTSCNAEIIAIVGGEGASNCEDWCFILNSI